MTEVIALLFSEKTNTYAMPDLGTLVVHGPMLVVPSTSSTTFPSMTTTACSHTFTFHNELQAATNIHSDEVPTSP